MEFSIKGYKAELVNSVFQSLLIAYLILLLIEQIWVGSVTTYLNLNYLLVMVILTGVLDVFSEHKINKEKPANWKDYSFIGLLAIIGFIIIKFRTGELGWLSWVISIVAGILITLISLLVLEEDDKD